MRITPFFTLAAVLTATLSFAVGATNSPDGVIGENYGSVFGRTVVSEFSFVPVSPHLGAMALSASGKTWLFGEFDGIHPTNKLPIARLLTSNGELDVGFGAGSGVLTATFPAASSQFSNLTAKIQPDGKPVIAGRMLIDGRHRGFVCRLNVAGNFDATFGDAGCREVRAFAYADEYCGIEDIALGSPNGGITVVGSCREADLPNQRPYTARLTSSGNFDPEYGAGAGVTLPSVAGGELRFLRALAVQGDGRFVATGAALRDTGDFDIALLGFGNDGTADLEFADGGSRLLALDLGGGLNDFGVAISLRPDGRILVAGLAQGLGQDGEIALWQVLPNGSPDLGFGTNGLVLGGEPLVDSFAFGPALASFFARVRLAVDDLGRAVVVGRNGSAAAGVDADVRVFRFSEAGRLDRGFGYDNRALIDIDNDVSVPGPGSSHDIPTHVSTSPGRILLGTISIRDNKSYMVTLTLEASHLFADGYENEL